MERITPDLIEQLLYEEEGSTLDFKQEQYRFINASDDEKSELLKDVLAFANAFRRNDAFILTGVKDVKGGRSDVIGILEDLDDAQIQQFVNSKTNRPVQFSYKAVTVDGRKIGVMQITIQERPIYLLRNYGKLAKEVVYLRRGSSTGQASPDEIAKMGITLDQGLTRYEPKPSIYFQDSQVVKRVNLGPFERVDESELVDQLEDFKQKYPLVDPDKYSDGKDHSKNDSSMNSMRGILFPPTTKEDARRYNGYLKEQYREFESYAKEGFDHGNQQIGRVDVRLIMKNEGTAPAEEIDIWLHFPDGMNVISENRLIKKWDGKSFPSPLPIESYVSPFRLHDDISRMIGSSLMYNMPNRGGSAPVPNVGGPRIRRTNSFEVTFKVRKVKHHHFVDLDALIVLFDDYNSASTFTIDYKITAANVPNVVTGSLTLEVEKAVE